MRFLKRLLNFFACREAKETLSYTGDRETFTAKGLPVSEVDLIIEKVKRGEAIGLRETNLILAEGLDIKALESTVFRLRESITKHALFNIESFVVLPDETGKVRDIRFRLNEVCYDLKMDITISASDFHDTFEPFHLDPKLTEGVSHDPKG